MASDDNYMSYYRLRKKLLLPLKGTPDTKAWKQFCMTSVGLKKQQHAFVLIKLY